LFRFRTSELTNLFGHSVGLLGRGISPTQGLLSTQDNTIQKIVETHLCLEQDSNPRSQCSGDRRQYVP